MQKNLQEKNEDLEAIFRKDINKNHKGLIPLCKLLLRILHARHQPHLLWQHESRLLLPFLHQFRRQVFFRRQQQLLFLLRLLKKFLMLIQTRMELLSTIEEVVLRLVSREFMVVCQGLISRRILYLILRVFQILLAMVVFSEESYNNHSFFNESKKHQKWGDLRDIIWMDVLSG